MPFESCPPVLVRPDGETFELTAPLHYQGALDVWTVPAGFVTDLATVPHPVTWLVPRAGTHTLAAILHDYLVTVALQEGRVSSVDADGIMRRTMRELGVPPVRRWLVWTGIRLGALASPRRRAGSLETLPAVATISLLTAPFVVPALLCIGVALVAYSALERVARLFS